jgi:hypothetical protein
MEEAIWVRKSFFGLLLMKLLQLRGEWDMRLIGRCSKRKSNLLEHLIIILL